VVPPTLARRTSPAERAGLTATLGRWPAIEVEDRHLFVRAGSVELRAVADDASFRDARRIRAVVTAFDLDSLAQL
jgi:hypothetical protein